MILVLEGPEKSGKSTLANAIAEKLNIKIRHWGPVNPDDRVYTKYLIDESQNEEWIIWDRCWPSEHIYGKLLRRNRRLSYDPWLGEWLHGRAVQANGLRIIVLPSTVEQLINRRDVSDLFVDPSKETRAYAKYAREFDWDVYVNPYTKRALSKAVTTICAKMKTISMLSINQTKLHNNIFAGNRNSNVIFVEENTQNFDVPGAWLPFTSSNAIVFARTLGSIVFKCGYMSCNNIPENLWNKKFIACGLDKDVISETKFKKVLYLPHLTKYFDNQSNKSSDIEDIVNKTKNFIKENI